MSNRSQEGAGPSGAGRAALWLSAASTLAYLLASEGLRNYARWLARIAGVVAR